MVMTGERYLQEFSTLEEGRLRLLEELGQLWEQVFGDSREYTDVFFETLFDPSALLLWEKEGRIGSMLFLLPVCYQDGQGSFLPGRYVYGVATHPDFRGKGYAGALLQEASREVARRGESFLALHPAEPSLYGFYRRFGYETGFTCVTVEAEKTAGSSCTLRTVPLSQQEYARHYLRLCRYRKGELLWPERALGFLYREAQAQEGGGFGILSGERVVGCGLFYADEHGILIKDWADEDRTGIEIFQCLENFWPGKRISLRISEKKAGKWGKRAVSQPFGMIHYIQEPSEGDSLVSCPGFVGAVLD